MSAFRTSGFFMMPCTPSAEIIANHRIITGPNIFPILPVPQRCAAKRIVRIKSAPGTSYFVAFGVTDDIPSIAESTEMLGVKTASAAKSETATMLTTITSRRDRPLRNRLASALSASVPPSPLFEARITTMTYLTVTIRVSPQMNMERSPYTCIGVTANPTVSPNAVCKAYSGLVPISP